MMVACSRVEDRRCPNSCSHALAAELELERVDVSGAFLASYQESLGVVILEPDAAYNALTVQTFSTASEMLARKLGILAEPEKHISVFKRLLLLLQTFSELPLDIASISHPGGCPGRCGRRTTGGKRWRKSVSQSLDQLLVDGNLRITGKVKGTLVLEVIAESRPTLIVQLTPNLFGMQPVLLEVSKTLMELVRVCGFSRIRKNSTTNQLSQQMISEFEKMFPLEEADRQRLYERLHRQSRRLKRIGLIINGEAKAFARFYNTLLNQRLALVSAQFAM